MKNKELLNICYKFFNRFITADELFEKLTNMNKEQLTKEETREINKMVNEIKMILDNVPNKVDDYVINKKQSIKNMIEKLEKILNNNDIDFLNKKLDMLRKDYESEMDSDERWFAIADYIDKNDYFNKNFENLSDYELLEFISQNIKAPFPPQFGQEKFDTLVKVGIENDKREWLWRLAFNYEGRNINFDEIVNYFIDVKDGYYIAELISAVGNDLNVDEIIDKINDKELIEDLKSRKNVILPFITEEQLNKIINKV